MITPRRMIGVFIMLLSTAAVAADEATAPAQEQYLAVFIDGHKVGHGRHVRREADGLVHTSEELQLDIRRGATAITVAQSMTARESPEGGFRGFEMTQQLGAMSMRLTGVVADGQLLVTIDTNGFIQQRRFDWPSETLMAEGLRRRLLETALEPGAAFTALTFEPTTLQFVTLRAEVGEHEMIDLLGRVTLATRVTAAMQIPGLDMPMVTYVNEAGEALKAVVPVAGMQVEIIACSREFALSDNDVADFLARFLVPSPTPAQRLTQAPAVTYTIVAADNEPLAWPQSSSQRVRFTCPGQYEITVHNRGPCRGGALPDDGDDADLRANLAATRYVQADHPAIVALAAEAVGDANDAATAARRIESFVHGYIDRKDLSVGYASAAEVAAARQGDCTEHAVLMAALCRAAGIPAQVVVGVVAATSFGGQRDVFVGHAWTRAWVGDDWCDLDATRAPNGFSAGHIAMSYGGGDPEDFFEMVNLLGRFEVSAAEPAR